MAKVPLVLLPGTLCNERLWHHQIEHLSGVANISIGNLTTSSTIQGMANDVLKNAPERFALAGLSLGGIVSLEILRQAPERVLKLALLDTTAHPPRQEQIPAWNHLLEIAAKDGVSKVTKDYLLPNLIHDQNPKKEMLTATIMNMAEEVGIGAYTNQLMAVMTKPNAFDILPSIQCETLLMVGRQDSLCTVAMHREMNEQIPHARFIIIEKCGHLCSLEQPEVVTKELRDWLQTGGEK